MSPLKTAACLLLLSCFFRLAGLGQLSAGTVEGTVTDSTGASLPSTAVTIRNLATNVIRKTITNDRGYYHIPDLQPGVYELKGEQTGFGTKIISSVVAEVGQTTREDFALAVGEQNESVVVSGQGPAIDVDNGRLSSVIQPQQVSNLPLQGRDVYSLLSHQPGAVLIPGGVFSLRLTAPPLTSVNGNRFRGNNYVLDGSTATNLFYAGEPSVTPPPDAVQEFEVQTSNFAPEYGRGNAATINIQTKSGTNQLHGDVYDYLQNTDLNARNYFVPQRLALVSNQFGFTTGGAIVKNRLFLFGSYEGVRRSFGRAEQDTVETDQFRQLVISQAPGTIAAQLYRQYPAQAILPGTQVSVGNLIPGILPTPAYFRSAASLPAMGIAETTTVDHQKSDQFLIRGDYSFSQNASFFARWIGSVESNDGGWNFATGISRTARGFRTPFDGFFNNLELGLDKIINPHLSNDARFSFQRDRSDFAQPNATVPDIENTLLDNVSGFGDDLFAPDAYAINSFEYRDIVDIEKGAHAIKFGAELRRVQDNSNHCQFCRPGFFFLSLSDFVQDASLFEDALVNPNTGLSTSTPRGYRRVEFGAFAQDDWRIAKKLTLNLGVRYDLFTAPVEAHGLLANILLGSGSNFDQQLASASVGDVKQLYGTNHLNFAPRLGLAWDPTGSGKSSVRLGYGIAFAPNDELITTNARFNGPGDVVGVTFAPSNYGLPATVNAAFTGGLNASGGFKSGARTRPWVVDPHLPTQYSEDWLASVQKDLGRQLVVEVSYIGTAGKHEEYYYDPNRKLNSPRPNPNFDNIVYVTDNASSIYHGLIAEVRRQFANGFSVQTTFRWSHYIADFDDSSPIDLLDNPVGAGVLQDVADPRAERANSMFDVPHSLTSNGTWDLPYFSKVGGVRGMVLGEWQLSSTLNLQSGRPFTVFTSAVDFNNDGGGNPIYGTAYDRPNIPAFGINLAGWSRSKYISGLFKASDFPAPALGTDGSLGRDTYRGPGLAQVNVSLAKTFRLFKGDLPDLQFRADLFNVFNRVNLYEPVSDLSNPLFGRSTQANNPRQAQLSLKIHF